MRLSRGWVTVLDVVSHATSPRFFDDPDLLGRWAFLAIVDGLEDVGPAVWSGSRQMSWIVRVRRDRGRFGGSGGDSGLKVRSDVCCRSRGRAAVSRAAWENAEVGLGGGPSEWDDYEWVRLGDLRPDSPRAGVRRRARRPNAGTPTGSLAGTAPELLRRVGVWADGVGPRVLLVDLDNLRAGPVRWRRRMAVVVSLARQADHAVLAGQQDAVRRARPHLAEFAARAQPVADGSDLADHVLLDAAEEIPGPTARFVVLSNDGIFAALAQRGLLTVVSPGGDALSDRLRVAATQVIDLAALEASSTGSPAPAAAGLTRGSRGPRASQTSRTRRGASAVA